MGKTIKEIRIDFINPADRSEIIYRDVTSAVSQPDARKFRRVLLLSPGAVLFKGDLPRCTYPLGLGYLGAVLERAEYEVRLVDCLAEGYYTSSAVDENGDFIRYGLTAQQIRAILREYAPDVVGVSSIFSNQSDVIEEIFQLARSECPDALLITGGAHARYFPDQYIDDLGADAVFLGEAENTIIEYLDWANGARELSTLQGIVVRPRGKDELFIDKTMPLVRRIGRSEGVATDIDAIPFPAWHLYNMELYFRIGAYQSPYTIGKRVAQVYTSRGCTAKCTFCTTTNFWGGKLRRRGPNNVIQELQFLRDTYGVDEFHIQDDNITNDKEHARLLFKELKQLGLPWCTPQGTALWRMDENLIDLMAESGCYQITFAIESGVQRVLNELIKKPLDLKKTTHLVKYAKSRGLDVHGFFIVGMPPMFGCEGESFEEMHATYRYAEDAGFTSASFFTATPIIGSELLTESLRQGFLAPDTPLYRMSYKQGLLNVPGLWVGKQIEELVRTFNLNFNANVKRRARREWNQKQY